MNDREFQLILERFKAIEERVEKNHEDVNGKLDRLLRFKWQIIGGSLVAGSFLSICVSVVVALIGK
jgi:hypothetical protein